MTRGLGVDVGQARDPTALAILDGWTVRHLERLPLGTAYPAVVARVAAVASAAAPLDIAVDATGVGRAIIDMLRAVGLDPLGVTITAGLTGRRQGQEITVPKSSLLLPLAIAVQDGRLKVAADCPLREALAAELASFRRTAGARGQLRITQGRAGHHGDLGIAVALALLVQGMGCATAHPATAIVAR